MFADDTMLVAVTKEKQHMPVKEFGVVKFKLNVGRSEVMACSLVGRDSWLECV